jgi:hypothetical protein
LKTWMTLVIKYILTFVAGYLTLSLIDGNAVWEVLLIALAVTALNYGVGDLMVLPTYGNIVASVADGLMAGIVAYIIALLWAEVTVSFLALLIFAVLIAIGEYFLHIYMKSSEEVAP